MTEAQKLFHAEIMLELRNRFHQFWIDTAVLALHDSDIHMNEKELAMSMYRCWNEFRSGGSSHTGLCWFIDLQTDEEKN